MDPSPGPADLRTCANTDGERPEPTIQQPTRELAKGPEAEGAGGKKAPEAAQEAWL